MSPLSLSLMLAALSWAAPAPKPAPDPQIQRVDEAMREAKAAMAKVGQCDETVTKLLRDNDAKLRALETEFNKKIPTAFNALLNAKRDRIDRQRKVCATQREAAGAAVNHALDVVDHVEPKSLKWYPAKRQEVMNLINTLRVAEKPAAAPAKKATKPKT